MFRIRLHGRGGQGIKSASRVLGTAFFHEGFEVQDAPRYGAERRGAPVFAYVRADRRPIYERGVIVGPGLIVVADDTLVGVPSAGVMQGIGADTVLVIDSETAAETWRDRLNLDSTVIVLPRPRGEAAQLLGAACAGAAARLTGAIGRDALASALDEEYAELGEPAVAASRAAALDAYDRMAPHDGIATETATRPAAGEVDWIDLPFDIADVSAPAIHAPLTSVQVRTGLWRTMRPIIDYDRCNGCWWVCSTFCPDDSISVTDDGRPLIDFDTCKGCMICVAQCPPHAIEAIPEATAAADEEAEAS
jgi:pyruvate ferredoxin oxidoreductase gamma subunit